MTTMQEQLVEYIEDAHALEQLSEQVLNSVIRLADAPELVEPLEHHKEETQRHQDLLKQRLEAHGTSPSTAKDAGMIMGAVGKALFDRIGRSDNAGKLARDGFVVEQLEIASYEMLERVASRAGDEETADVARRNRADEEAMAGKIAAAWDLAVDLSLQSEGLQGAPPIPPPRANEVGTG